MLYGEWFAPVQWSMKWKNYGCMGETLLNSDMTPYSGCMASDRICIGFRTLYTGIHDHLRKWLRSDWKRKDFCLHTILEKSDLCHIIAKKSGLGHICFNVNVPPIAQKHMIFVSVPQTIYWAALSWFSVKQMDKQAAGLSSRTSLGPLTQPDRLSSFLPQCSKH